MPSVLIIHEVASYPDWKHAFDEAAALRKKAGEITYDLLRFEDDSNRVVHFSEWSSLADARAFFESAEVADIRRKAGVREPTFCYLERLEQARL